MGYNFAKPFARILNSLQRTADKFEAKANARIKGSSADALIWGAIGGVGLAVTGLWAVGFGLSAVSAVVTTLVAAVTLNPVGVVVGGLSATVSGVLSGLLAKGAACCFGISKSAFDTVFKESEAAVAQPSGAKAPAATDGAPSKLASMPSVKPEFAEAVAPAAEAAPQKPAPALVPPAPAPKL